MNVLTILTNVDMNYCHSLNGEIIHKLSYLIKVISVWLS